MSDTTLKGKTALVTGSTSGIGLGIATAYAAQGANIVMNGLGKPEDIQKAQETLEAAGAGKVIFHGADMTKPDQIEDMIKQAEKEFGHLDILVNNAGIQHVAPVEEFPPEKWDAIIAINMTSAFHIVRHALPAMKKAGWGRIINIVSAHGLVASPFKSAYVTAKHGMMGFTKTIALEVAEHNITVNAICPGYVETPLVQGQIKDQAKARGITEQQVVTDVLLKAQYTKKFVTTEQIADIACFLCKDSAQNITGTHISVDGGWTAA